MDLFGNKVDIKIETVILFLLIGIVIVLLLFCFEPWNAISPARDPTPQQVITQVEQTALPVSNDSKVSVVEPFQQVTADARILYKKVGFTALGSNDAKVNILRFKTRPIKDSEKDFQVAYMFTQDIETLKSLNKGEKITLQDSTTTTQPPATITPPAIVLKNTLYEIYGLPADYVTYSMDLVDRVVANYTTNQGDDKAKLTAVQNLIKDEFNKLPADGQEWQKRLKNGIDKITTELTVLPLTQYPPPYSSIINLIRTYYNNNKIIISVLLLIEKNIYSPSSPAPFTLTPVSGIGSLLKYKYSYDTIKPIVDSVIVNDLYNKITTYSTATPQTQPIISSDKLAEIKTKFTTDVTARFTRNRNLILLTSENITTIRDNIYKSFDAFLESKFSEDITTTTQPAAAQVAETDPTIIQVLQAIGSKYYDPATGERKSRDNDFYLEFSNGLEVNIKFLFNYITNMTGEVKCEATITELPPGSASDPAYKTYKFDTCQLEYIDKRMIITFTKTTSPVNYAKVAGGKYSKVTVIQTFKLEINLGDTPISESGDTFQIIINRVVFFNTFMSYSLAVKLDDSAGSVKPIYTINLFPQSITSAFESLKEYTKSALNKTTERLLKDNVAEIVTPMFMVDQRLDRTEGILAKIKDHYRFNELSNAQSGYRFYPVSE